MTAFLIAILVVTLAYVIWCWRALGKIEKEEDLQRYADEAERGNREPGLRELARLGQEFDRYADEAERRK